MNTLKKIGISSLLIFSPASKLTTHTSDNLYHNLETHNIHITIPEDATPIQEVVSDSIPRSSHNSIEQDMIISDTDNTPSSILQNLGTDKKPEDSLSKLITEEKQIIITPQISKHQDDSTTLPSNTKTISTNQESKSIPNPKYETQKIDKRIYFSPVLDSIVVPSSTIDFDKKYVQEKVYELLESSFHIQGDELIFTPPSEQERIIIYNTMDNLKTHIKSQNGPLIKILLGKKTLRNFISDEFDNIHRILIEHNNFSYKGGKEQFRKDFNSIINIYK